MGILNIVFGSLGLLCGACGVAANVLVLSLASASGPGPGAEIKELLDYMDKNLPGHMAVEIGRGVGILVLSVLLLVAGIGLLGTKSWARWLSIAYAVLSIPLHVGWAVFELGFVLPLTQKFAKSHNAFGAQQDNTVIQAVGAIIFTILAVVYALVLLIFMFLPGLSAAFNQGQAGRRRGDEDYEDDHEEEAGDEDDYDDRRRDRY
jgi:hypothetical protein